MSKAPSSETAIAVQRQRKTQAEADWKDQAKLASSPSGKSKEKAGIVPDAFPLESRFNFLRPVYRRRPTVCAATKLRSTSLIRVW